MSASTLDEKQKGELSKAIYERAVEVIPGGVSRNTIFRKPHPYYVGSANGSYIKDIEGVERVDFANNMASLIHGHSHPDIVNAVTEQLQRGTAYTMGTEAEVLLAELLISRSPGFERIRFMNSGTEAVMTMIKASRAYTGKPKIAKAEGAYHGTYDYAEISQTANSSNWGDINKPNAVPVVNGTPQGAMDDVIIFPYNDIEKTLNLLDQNAQSIACVLIDLVPHRVGMFSASNEFIDAIYKWTRKNNALLVFDEVITYRVNYSGAQDNYSVKPDLTALGKIIGGGFPVGALAGKAEIMKVLDPTEKILRHPHSGTFSANPISMTAGRVAMELFDEQAVLDLNALTMIARNQIEESIKIADVPVSITGAGSMFRLHLQESPPKGYREINQTSEAKAIITELLDHLFFNENIIMINTLASMFATTLTQSDVDRLSEGLLNGFKLVKPKIEQLS
jgi:glutamate-1-semialdehyde 2,1-aminomutase